MMGKVLSGKLSCPCDRSCFCFGLEKYISIWIYKYNFRFQTYVRGESLGMKSISFAISGIYTKLIIFL